MIAKFGLIDKPIINRDLTIIGGHQRIKILKKQKVKSVECWIPEHELSEKEVEHLCIGLNLNQGSFDYDILANEFEIMDLLNMGFEEDKLMGIFGDKEVKKSKEKKKKECPNCGCEF